MANKVIVEVRQKLEHGQNLFRRSTVEKLVTEYERLLLRNVTLEQSAAQPTRAVDAAMPSAHLELHCPQCHTIIDVDIAQTPRP